MTVYCIVIFMYFHNHTELKWLVAIGPLDFCVSVRYRNINLELLLQYSPADIHDRKFDSSTNNQQGMSWHAFIILSNCLHIFIHSSESFGLLFDKW